MWRKRQCEELRFSHLLVFSYQTTALHRYQRAQCGARADQRIDVIT